MESEKLEITLHSANGLFDVKVFGTMDPYAIVAIVGDGKVLEALATGVATKGGCSPTWNCPMQFSLAPMHKNYTLFCEIKHDGKLFDRDIGKVQVPFADLLVGNGSGEKLSYPVKIDSGEVYGEIILSHKFSKPMSVRSSGEKSGDNSGTGGKVDGGGPRKKVNGKKKVKGKKKKGEEKKKGGMMKKIAGNVATKVVTEVGIMAATVGVALGLDYILDGEEEVGEEDGEEEVGEEEVGEEDGEEDDGQDDEYEDEDEEGDEDEYEDEDEY